MRVVFVPFDKGGKMFFAIFSGIFLFVAALAVLFGVLRGKRKIWQVSLARIILTVVTALLAVAVSLTASWVVLGMVADSLISGGTLGEIGSLMGEVPSAQTAILALVSMIVTPILFLIFYAILRPIAAIFVKPLSRLMAKKKLDAAAKDEEGNRKKLTKAEKNAHLVLPKSHWLSALLGGLSGLLLLCVLLVPLVGGLGIIDDIAEAPVAELAKQDAAFAEIPEVLDAVTSNVGTVTVRMFGGGLLYDLMTSYPTDDGFATLRHESGLVKSIANAAITLSDENADAEKIKADLGEVSASFDRSALLPSMLAELVSAAADDWSRGEDFHGVEAPSLGGDDLEPVVTSVLNALAKSDSQTVKQDVKTIIDIVSVLIVNDTLDEVENDPMALLSNEATTAELLRLLLENPRLNIAVDGVADFGMKLLLTEVEAPESKDGMFEEFLADFDAIKDAPAPLSLESETPSIEDLYAEIFDAYGLRVDAATVTAAAEAKRSGADMKAWVAENVVANAEAFNKKTELISADMITDGSAEITDAAVEAKALAHAFSVVSDMMNDIGGEEFDVKNVLGSMGTALDSFSATQTIGKERTAYILKALLQSELVHDKIGFTVLEATDSAESLIKNSEAKSYDTMLSSLAKIVDAVEAASSSDADTLKAVTAMLDDLTPESAEVIKTMATPNVVQNYGVSKQSSVPVSNMISDTFGNLADQKDSMTEEEYAKESAAVSDMMNVLMSAGSEGGAVFGDESTTGKSAGDYIDAVMDSKVMSQTVVDTVYGDGSDAQSDPLASDREVSEGEKTEFINATNEKWNSMSADERNEDSKKELTAIGAVLNINITLADGVWVAA